MWYCLWNVLLKIKEEYCNSKTVKIIKKDIMTTTYFSPILAQLKKLHSIKSWFSTWLTSVGVSLSLHIDNPKYLGLSLSLLVMITLGNLTSRSIFPSSVSREKFFKNFSIFLISCWKENLHFHFTFQNIFTAYFFTLLYNSKQHTHQLLKIFKSKK